MAWRVEYDKSVKWWIPASVAVFGLFFLSALLPSSCQAQINGTPPSVTSPGFGGRAINGTRPSVTSLGPGGFAPSAGTSFRSTVPRRDRDGQHVNHSHRLPYYGGLYAVPYTADSTSDSAVEDDAEYQGGPTIFDRRGSGPQAYIPPVKDVAPPHSNEIAASDPPESEPALEITMLVFKDGHQLEVGNYAIVGRTLYDMTPGHPRKVALADLDLAATQKQNDERGVTFQLPPSAQAN